MDSLIKRQNAFFKTGKTLTYDFRLVALNKLKKAILNNLDELYAAFSADYNKGKLDVLTTEVGFSLGELNYFLKNLKRLMRDKKVHTSLTNFKSYGKLIREPYGNTLIVAPWNYPFYLTICPLIGAIAGGNTAIVKPSNYSPNVSNVIEKILSCFSDDYIAVVKGGREQNALLFEQKFDFIFFTGGVKVGKILLEKASRNLTPCVLELGGKSPCIVDSDCDLELAAKRICWAKFLNAGQTCVAPDYVLVSNDVEEEFVKLAIKYTKKMFFENGVPSKNYPYVITEKHVERLIGLIDRQKLVFGGNVSGRMIEPTILRGVTFDDECMKEEIFGPIMPIISFTDLDSVIEILREKEKPLALYYFGKDKTNIDNITHGLSFGGGCVNDCTMHVSEEKLPFGGVGNSGMGSYHGKRSFETFTHEKSLLIKGKTELNLKYPPVTEKEEKLIKKILLK